MKKKSAHKKRLRKAEALHDSGSSNVQQSPLEKIASFFAHQAALPPVEKKQKVMQRRGT
jgi:hypothetical protein